MSDLLELQLRAIAALQQGERSIEEMVQIISSSYSNTLAEQALLQASLRELVLTCIRYGKLKSTHESFLKNDKGSTQKEG